MSDEAKTSKSVGPGKNPPAKALDERGREPARNTDADAAERADAPNVAKPGHKGARAPLKRLSAAAAASRSFSSAPWVRVGLGCVALTVALGVGGVVGARTRPAKAAAPAPSRMASLDQAIPWKGAARAEARDAERLRIELAAVRADLLTMRGAAAERQSDGQKQLQDLRALRVALDGQKTDIASIRADLAARSERTERDLGQRGDKLSERLDRLERRLSDQTATASIPKAEPAKLAGDRQAQDKQAQGKQAHDKSGHDYVLRDVARGVALIETRSGMFDVIPGDLIPGAGRVLSIERHAGKWRVVTSSGVIDDRIE